MYNQTNYALNDLVGVERYVVPRQPQMHWALRVGPCLYELITVDNMRIEWRYVDETRAESWASQIPEKIVGETSATDTELANMGKFPMVTLDIVPTTNECSRSSDLADEAQWPNSFYSHTQPPSKVSFDQKQLPHIRPLSSPGYHLFRYWRVRCIPFACFCGFMEDASGFQPP